MTLDKIDPRYDYAPDVVPSDGLRSTVYDKTHGILFLTSVAGIERLKEGDYLVTMRAKSIGDLDAAAPSPEPVDPPVEPTPVDPPTDPSPVPGPVSPPITGGFDAFGPAELMAALKTAKGGEVITAKAGYGYDGLTIDGINPASQVTVQGEGAGARFGMVMLTNASNLRFLGVTSYMTAPYQRGKAKPYLFQARANTRAIVVEGCDLRSRADAGGYNDWSLQEWLDWRMGGVLLEGPDSHILHNSGIGLEMAIGIGGPRSSMVGNEVMGVGGDFFRVTADDCAVIGNKCGDMYYLKDGNHEDGGQFFAADGTGRMYRITVRGNRIIECVTNRLNPLAAVAQGIGGYGSPKSGGGSTQTVFEGITVEDNEVEVSAPHGIRLCIIRDGIVRRNVLRYTGNLPTRDESDFGFTRMLIDGQCANTVVEDNTAPRFQIAAAAQQARNVVV